LSPGLIFGTLCKFVTRSLSLSLFDYFFDLHAPARFLSIFSPIFTVVSLEFNSTRFFFADLHKAERGMKLGLPMKINSISLAAFCLALKKLEDIELIAK